MTNSTPDYNNERDLHGALEALSMFDTSLFDGILEILETLEEPSEEEDLRNLPF